MTPNAAPRGRDARLAEHAAAAALRQRDMEDRVLIAVLALDPADRSIEAQQLREAALSICDHREVVR